jgi:hypothetical protein
MGCVSEGVHNNLAESGPHIMVDVTLWAPMLDHSVCRALHCVQLIRICQEGCVSGGGWMDD